MEKIMRTLVTIVIGGFFIGVITSAIDTIYQLLRSSFYVTGFFSSLNFFAVNSIVNSTVAIAVVSIFLSITFIVFLLMKKERGIRALNITRGFFIAFVVVLVITAAVPINTNYLPNFATVQSLIMNGLLAFAGIMFAVVGVFIAGRFSRIIELRPAKIIIITVVVIAAITTFAGMLLYEDYRKLPRREEKTGPNVIIITIDALRRDYVSCYDDSKIITPNLDKFAAKSALIENSYCNNPWTIPSMMTMNTGHYPSVHNTDFNHSAPLNMLMLPQILESYGYHTEGFVGNNILYGEYGFSRGFNRYVEYGDLGKALPFRRATFYRFITKFRASLSKYLGTEKDTTEWCTDALTYSIRRNQGKDQPYFLWVHYLDPHTPLTPPREYVRGDDAFVDEALRFGLLKSSNEHELVPADSEYAVELYRAEVAYIDDMFGRVLEVFDENGVWDDSVIIVTSDHGEEHFEHGYYGHGRTHYSDIMAVPLMVYLPDQPGRRIYTVASIIDIPVTVLDYVGAEEFTELPGRSLIPYIEGDSMDSGYSFGDRTVDDMTVKSVRDGDFCLIRSGKDDYEFELYDMKNDPFEHNDISDEMVGDKERLATILEDWAYDLEAMEIGDGKSVDLDASRTDKLKGLGYLK